MMYTQVPVGLKVPIEIAIDKFFHVLSALPAQQHTVILEQLPSKLLKCCHKKLLKQRKLFNLSATFSVTPTALYVECKV